MRSLGAVRSDGEREAALPMMLRAPMDPAGAQAFL